jgi:lysozyme
VIPGIDTSSYNGRIDWARVAEAGIKFCFHRAFSVDRDGSLHRDVMFDANVASCAQHGIASGAYGFAHPSADHRFQALELAKHGLLSIPPVIDLEVTDDLSTVDLVLWMSNFLALLEAETKRRCGVYTGAYTLGEAAHMSGATSSWLWLAQYTLASAPFAMPPGWDRWTFWQHLGNATKNFAHDGRVQGVSTPVDLNWFNGTSEEFDLWRANTWTVHDTEPDTLRDHPL